MIKEINIHNEVESRLLYDLQQLSYKVEADLMGFWDLPPLKETLEALQNSSEIFYGYHDGKMLVGAIAYERVGNVLDICRLIVHPHYFRRGIAGVLLREIEGLEKPESITVATGSKNTPALKFYEYYGFIAQGEFEVVPGVFITRFKK